jgi:hypothetical protein
VDTPEVAPPQDVPAVDAAASLEAANRRIAELENVNAQTIEAEAERILKEMFPGNDGQDPHAAAVPAGREPQHQQDIFGPQPGQDPGFDPTSDDARLARLEKDSYDRQVADEVSRITGRVEELRKDYPHMDPNEVLLEFAKVPDANAVNEDKFFEFHAKRSHDRILQSHEAYHQSRLEEERAGPTPPPIPTGAAGIPTGKEPPKTFKEAKAKMIEKLNAAWGGK